MLRRIIHIQNTPSKQVCGRSSTLQIVYTFNFEKMCRTKYMHHTWMKRQVVNLVVAVVYVQKHPCTTPQIFRQQREKRLKMGLKLLSI